MKILLVEDNLQIGQNIVRYAAMQNITCDLALDGKDGFYKALQNFYDVIILDINLPSMNGIEILKELRHKGKETQILMLTSNSLNSDIVGSLEVGADDYLTKPFDFEVLFAHIYALNRRNLKNKSNSIAFGKYQLDLEKTILTYENNEIKLSSLEFNLLTYFAQNPNVTLSRQQIYEKVWGEFDGDIMFSKTIEVYIGYLRKKIGTQYIQTIKGLGYKFLTE